MSNSSSRGFVEETLDTADAFIEALRPSNGRWQFPDPTLWAFRGQADATWMLAPTLARTSPFSFLNPISAHFYKAVRPNGAAEEVTLLIDFLHSADKHGLAVPEDTQLLRTLDRFRNDEDLKLDRWPSLHVVSLMALAQHHGLPTRLLDWSWRAPIAAYFSCLEPSAPAAHLSVWSIQTNFIKMAWRINAQLDEDPEYPWIDIVTAPQATNRNLAAQAGLFTLHRGLLDTTYDFARIVTERLDLIGGFREMLDLPVLRKLNLPRSEVKPLLRLLAYEGTTAASVFPGYDGIVKSMQERHRWHPIVDKVAELKAKRNGE